MREKRVGNFASQHHHRPGMPLVLMREKASAPYRKLGDRLGEFGLGPAQDHTLHALILITDRVGLACAQRNEPGSKRGGGSNIGTRFAQIGGVPVVDVLPHPELQRHARGVLAAREPAHEVGARTQAVHLVLNVVVQSFDDGRHRDHRRHSDHDAYHRQAGPQLVGPDGIDRHHQVLVEFDACHRSARKASTGSSLAARVAG